MHGRQEIGGAGRGSQVIAGSAGCPAVPESATILRIGRACVRFWIRRLEGQGPQGLYNEPRMEAERLPNSASLR